ncbi:hypothetical protein LPJ66_000009 [Kickxella alabastrina]|uniref:Uncharacterized protein n=1 Tax=Kickxella alabastrina TaxID=61397 RepID=A0ACC1IXD6_9FUNG|nr:hypothetical protein LPJ66_000009 [Kickxella alabastrina]
MTANSISNNRTNWPNIFERDVCPIPKPHMISMSLLLANDNSTLTSSLVGSNTPGGNYNRRRVASHATAYSGTSTVVNGHQGMDVESSESEVHSSDDSKSLTDSISSDCKATLVRNNRLHKSRSTSMTRLRKMVSGIFRPKSRNLVA